jgi:hypothetical protein
MGFPCVLYSFRGNPYNNLGVFISTPRFPSDSHAIPSVKMEKHAAISAIHMDPQDCSVERLGIPAKTPGLHTTCARCQVEFGPIPPATLGITPDAWPIRPQPPAIAQEMARCTACIGDFRQLSMAAVLRPTSYPLIPDAPRVAARGSSVDQARLTR